MERYGLGVYLHDQFLPFDLIKADITGIIHSNFAKLTLFQQYKNDLAISNSEAIFVFPIDHSAAVIGFCATYREMTVIAKLTSKKEGKKIYKEAKNKGQFTALTEEVLGDVFRISIGQIQPKEKIELVFEYLISLNENKIIIPTYVAPRYSPRKFTTTLETAFSTEKKILYLNLQCLSPQVKVTSPTHQITMDEQTIQFQDLQVALNKDIVLLLEEKKEPWILLDRENHFFMLSVPRPIFPQKKIHHEYIFIVDQSGSMAGQKMQALKQVLELALACIPNENSSFNIVRFGSTYEALYPKSQIYNDDSLKNAKFLIEKFEADLGGTELKQPILEYFIKPEPNKSKFVLVFTDGEFTNQNEIAAHIQKMMSQVHDEKKETNEDLRLYTIGIGDNISRDALNKLAVAGDGQCHIANEGNLNAILVEIFEHIQQYQMQKFQFHQLPFISQSILMQKTNHQISWIGSFEKEFESDLKILPVTEIKLEYNSLENDAHSFFLKWENAIENETCLPFLWAKQKIRDLERKNAKDPEIKNISLKYGVLSNQTAFVLVDPRNQEKILGNQQIFTSTQTEMSRSKSPQIRTFSKSANLRKVYYSGKHSAKHNRGESWRSSTNSSPKSPKSPKSPEYDFEEEEEKNESYQAFGGACGGSTSLDTSKESAFRKFPQNCSLDNLKESNVYRSLYTQPLENFLDLQEEMAPHPTTDKKQESWLSLFNLISLQHANGSFHLNKQEEEQIPSNVIQSIDFFPSKMISAEARKKERFTLIVLVYLHTKLKQQEKEWKLMAQKAENYLFKNGLNQTEWETWKQISL